jgi:hypothetical protein
MKLLTNPNGGDGSLRPGVMIPIPQYPLYSASLAEYNIDQVLIQNAVKAKFDVLLESM